MFVVRIPREKTEKNWAKLILQKFLKRHDFKEKHFLHEFSISVLTQFVTDRVHYVNDRRFDLQFWFDGDTALVLGENTSIKSYR